MLTISKEKLEASVGTLQNVYNTKVISACSDLAKVLKEEPQNALVEQALDACKKFQNIYNANLEGCREFLKDISEVVDIGEYLDKIADMGTVNNHDASFKGQGIDSSAVRM